MDTYMNPVKNFGGGVPAGTVISVMRNSAPAGYLKCDGTVYNILDYPVLANLFEAEFGSKNYFGGDGAITFAVPDLQGEFLRGTGTNSHTNQGSGANVGVHQDATVLSRNWLYNTTVVSEVLVGTGNTGAINSDGIVTANGLHCDVTAATAAPRSSSFPLSRPTNTSVLYCIKY